MPVTTCTELTAMWERKYGFRECVGCHELKSVGIEEDGAWICEDCDGPECGCCEEKLLNQGCGDIVNRGCCSDGACGHEPPIEALCGSCGTWDEEDEVWRCPDCQEEHENQSAPPCEICKKPVWSNNDVYQKIHDCIVCQDCFDENEEAHKKEEDGDGFVVCEHCSKGGGAHASEDCPDYEPPEADGDGSGDE